MSESLNDIVSRIVLEHKLADARQLDKAVEKQAEIRKKKGRKEPLERVLADLKIIDAKQLKGLRYAILYYLVRKIDRFYGKIAVQSDICDSEDVESALAEQKKQHRKKRRLVRLSTILLDKGLIKKSEDKAIQAAIEQLSEKRKARRRVGPVVRSAEEDEDLLTPELSDELDVDDEIDDLEALEQVSEQIDDEVPSVDDLGVPDDDEVLTKSSESEEFDDELELEDDDDDDDDDDRPRSRSRRGDDDDDDEDEDSDEDSDDRPVARPKDDLDEDLDDLDDLPEDNIDADDEESFDGGKKSKKAGADSAELDDYEVGLEDDDDDGDDDDDDDDDGDDDDGDDDGDDDEDEGDDDDKPAPKKGGKPAAKKGPAAGKSNLKSKAPKPRKRPRG